MDKLNKAFELFDAYNKQDPNTITWNNEQYPAEYFYALQLYNWVKKLNPGATEILLLASRSQHIGRWKIPRDEYPMGKAGYFKWRSTLAKFHSDTAGNILAEAGFSPSEIKSVQHIILKEDLKKDDDVQTIENALCLVFLEFQYEDFISKHDEAMVKRILRKTWAKMSEPGKEAALLLSFNEREKSLILQAVANS